MRRRIALPTRHHPKAHWKLLFIAAAAAQEKSQPSLASTRRHQPARPENVSKRCAKSLDCSKIV
jgi:hypothetical protein